MTDEFSGIFDDLTPEDFAKADSTARIETRLPDSPHAGPEAFDRFVKHNIDVVKSSSLAAGGNPINPVAILSSASTQWTFTPNDDETMGDYLQRLHDEAKALGATWVFISRETQVGSILGGEDMPDAGDEETAQRHLQEGGLSRGVVFFAQRHEGDEWEHQHGLMLFDDNQLGAPVFGSTTQTLDFFAQILQG